MFRKEKDMPEKSNLYLETLNADELLDVSDLFKVLGDFTRIRILDFLLREEESSAGNIAMALSMTASAISHQLKTLKQSRIVKSRREGKMIYYSLDDEHVKLIIGMAIEHVRHRGK